MGKNRVFFPQASLNEWLSEGKVDLAGEDLTILGEARRYRIVEAARIVREVTGNDDANELVGRVKSRVFLDALGAELFETSMLLGDNAYDVVPGFLGAPVGTLADHRAALAHLAVKLGGVDGPSSRNSPVPPATDEELLAQFLLKSL